MVRLPTLSVVNVRELLKASLPLPQLTLKQAYRLVIERLVGGLRATASRRMRWQRTNDATLPKYSR